MSTIDANARRERGELFVQALVHGGIERMAGADQDGVEVLVLLQVFLVEGDLAIGGLGLAEPADGCQPVGTEVGQDVLDAPEAIGAGLDLQADLAQRH